MSPGLGLWAWNEIPVIPSNPNQDEATVSCSGDLTLTSESADLSPTPAGTSLNTTLRGVAGDRGREV